VGGTPIVSLLSCAINGSDISVSLAPGSRLAAAHNDADSVIEHTTCNYGLNRDVEQISSEGGMRPVGIDELREVRAIERSDHRFFVATLYQPQLRSSPEAPHPLLVSFLNAAAEQAQM
jgi:CTP synthase (UTP-ammonia lyase)